MTEKYHVSLTGEGTVALLAGWKKYLTQKSGWTHPGRTQGDPKPPFPIPVPLPTELDVSRVMQCSNNTNSMWFPSQSLSILSKTYSISVTPVFVENDLWSVYEKYCLHFKARRKQGTKRSAIMRATRVPEFLLDFSLCEKFQHKSSK